MGVVPPAPGFNQFLAETCTRHGALFVSDEVMTGFRASREGQWGLDGKVEGWRPDLMTFGKVMGGGFPAAAFGGRADVMAHLRRRAPSTRPAPSRGTRSRPPPGLATLRLATDEVYAHLHAAGDAIKAGVVEAFTAAGVPHVIQSTGTMFSVFFTDTPVTDFAGASRQDLPAYAAFFHAMLDRGVHLPPSAYEAWFLSSAHDERAVQTILAALPAGRGGRRPSRRKAMSDTTTVHLLRHGEVHNPEGVLYGRRDGYHLSDRGRRWPGWSPRRSRTATSRTWSPRRSSAPRRPRARWPRRAGSRSPRTPGSSSPPTCSRASASVWGTARCAGRRPGGTSGTPSGRRGASPTSRSSRG